MLSFDEFKNLTEREDHLTALKCCAICGHANGHLFYNVKEMMQGSRHKFLYMECGNCGCVQLLEPPIDIESYYAANYYSLQQNPESLFKPALKGFLKKQRDAFAITGKGWLGRVINSQMPSPNVELYHLQKARIGKRDKILDIGAGAGMLTYILYNAGFKNISGIDPFLKNDIRYRNGLMIAAMSMEDFDTKDFDVLMFNHSFEHMPDPKAVLKKAAGLLKPKGKCIIRIPTASSYAWEHYRENWVQLDAPRHYFLYSIDALRILAAENGFSFTYLADESTSFQFLGSEQYKMDIPLHGDERSYFDGNNKFFSSEQIRDFDQKARQLNAERKGDSISVMLQKL